MTSRTPEPPDPFEEEGVPGTESPLPAKEATGDAQEGMAPPADRPIYSDGYGVTAAEQARGETIDAYLAAEEPEPAPPPEQPAGRLVDPDEGAREDTEPDLVGTDVGTDGGGLSAEERAVHVQPET